PGRQREDLRDRLEAGADVDRVAALEDHVASVGGEVWVDVAGAIAARDNFFGGAAFQLDERDVVPVGIDVGVGRHLAHQPAAVGGYVVRAGGVDVEEVDLELGVGERDDRDRGVFGHECRTGGGFDGRIDGRFGGGIGGWRG